MTEFGSVTKCVPQASTGKITNCFHITLDLEPTREIIGKIKFKAGEEAEREKKS